MLGELLQEQGDVEACACITGSVGMGMSERHSIPFIQEVVAARRLSSRIIRR